jgi:esterase/lipase superfamily enzyme
VENPDWSVVPVYYGTDRLRTAETKRIVYGSGRAEKLELGRVLITVPKQHQVPNIERPWAIKVPFFDITIFQQAEDPKKHFTLKEISSLSREEFLAAVRERLAASTAFRKQALVFIHGYNNDFDFAAFRAAQLAYDLNFDGAPFLYSWPAGSGVGTFGYDLNSAELTGPHLKEFLELVIRETGAESVSIIAHSMGNLPLLRVLRDLAPTMPPDVKIDQVIMAAPAIDRDLFRQLTRDFNRVGRGATLYASSNDRAMTVGRELTAVPYAGDVPKDGPVIVDGVDTIDISSLSTDTFALNHSTYAERTALIKDIELILQKKGRPMDRLPTYQVMTTPRGDYWRYPAQ